MQELTKLAGGSSSLRIVCPFVKEGAIADLLAETSSASIELITRFNLDHFSEGVSDITALRRLLRMGARIRGVKRLHAKLYLFDDSRAIIASTNLTQAGLKRNHELGVIVEDDDVARGCGSYFKRLWEDAGPDLTNSRLDEWEERVETAQILTGPTSRPGLGDEGADVYADVEPQMPARVEEPRQAFVKFFGEGHNRAERSFHVFDELQRGGSHFACTYPIGRRPRAVRDNDLMFMGRLVHSPNDTLIYGRAVAVRYEEGRDEASPEEIARRPWKERWPHYIRVHHPEFISGPLANGVSLGELMDELGPYAFGSTTENAERGSGNENPRKAIRQAPAVRLAPEGLKWLNDQLEQSFDQHGTISATELASLDWPTLEI